MEKYKIPTKTDTELSLQLVEVQSGHSSSEVKTYKELGILLSTEIGARGDGYQITTLNKEGIDTLIERLEEMKEEVTY